MKIIDLDWTETIPIRHSVLWPDKTPDFCRVDGDQDALHFGVLDEETLVSVASIYPDGSGARLRKFATLEKYQGQGVGTYLLGHILSVLESRGVSYFWCDARESALGFYKRFGMEREGERFYKSEVAYFRMSRSLP